MAGPALWIGDRVTGHNRWTDELVRGTLKSIDESELDGVRYATVETTAGEAVLPVRWINGPRACVRPTDPDGTGECERCGRDVYRNGPYDTDRLTHKLERVHSRYR